MPKEFKKIIKELPQLRDECRAMREILLTNLVMIGEIPAPTFGEAQRLEYLQRRFAECHLQNCSTDSAGNVVGIYPGKDGSKNILVVAHADTVFPAGADHTVSLQSDHAIGIGLADNSLGLAVLASLPTLFERLGLEFESNLILMGATSSLGHGNLEGLRFFLDNNRLPIRAGVCVEGAKLGRLSMASIGMLRGEITCSISEEYDWSRFGTTSAILTLNEVINRIMEIPLPKRPRTNVVLGTIEGGQSFNTIAKKAVLGFEIRSESADMVTEIAQQMHNITAELASATGAEITLDIFARRQPGGINFNHPLAERTREIMEALEIPLRVAPSTSELSAFIDQQLPALTTAITTAENLNEPNEKVYIESMFTGIAQLVGILLAIDGGYCDEN
ncbi:MAG: M20/M25/M40 family metallo-hydrolase [Lentisphaeria bacterium]